MKGYSKLTAVKEYKKRMHANVHLLFVDVIGKIHNYENLKLCKNTMIKSSEKENHHKNRESSEDLLK